MAVPKKTRKPPGRARTPSDVGPEAGGDPTPRQPVTIDRGKLRAAVRKLGHKDVFYMLYDAIDFLSPAKLHEIARKHIDLKRLRPDSDTNTKANLLEDVKAFDKASRAGEYYESFMVNYKNCTEQSTGTTAWMAEFRRLIARCATEEKKGTPADVREAFDILLGLLDYIDECNDDVIFFADEGGSWLVGVDWDRVLPPWFKVLSATAAPREYADRINSVLAHHYDYGRDKMLVIARKTATPEQRRSLAVAAARQASRRRGGRKP